MAAANFQVYGAPLRITRKLRKALKPGGERAMMGAAIEALENKAADLTDLLLLVPLARSQGIELIDELGARAQLVAASAPSTVNAPRKKGQRARRTKAEKQAAKRAQEASETIPQRRRRLRAEARERQQTIVPELRAAIRDLKRAKKQRAAHCKRQAKRRQQKIASMAKRAERDLAARVAKLKDRARETAKACNLRDLDKLDQLLAQLAQEQETIKRLREEARGLKSTRGAAGGRAAAEKRAEALDVVRRNVADDPILLALWEKHGRTIKKTPRASLTETFLDWVHNHPEAIAEIQAEQERNYAAEAEAMLALAREAHRDPDTCQARLTECEKWLREVAPEGLSATDVPF